MFRTRPSIVALFVVLSTLGTALRSAQGVRISSEASAHLTEIIAVLQREWLHRDKMDWDVFRRRVFEKAGAAQTIPETYDAIRLALTLLGDRHTYYRTAAGENEGRRAARMRHLQWLPSNGNDISPECHCTAGPRRLEAVNGPRPDS